RSRTAASSSSRSKLRALRTSGRFSVTRATPAAGRPASDTGKSSNTRLCSADCALSVRAVWVTPFLRPETRRPPQYQRPARLTRTIGASAEIRRILEDEERGEAGRDLAQDATGLAHRIGREARVERGAVVELHLRHDREVRLPAERAAHPAHPRVPQARRRGGGRARAGSSSAAPPGSG